MEPPHPIKNNATFCPCSTTWCEKKTYNCHRPWMQTNCAMTCGQCAAAATPGPSPPPPTLAPCQDIKPSTFCEKKTDKCDQSWFQRNCALTCDQCVADSSPPAGPASPPPCRDLKSTTWCAKKLDKCEARPYLQRNCAFTCGQCGAVPTSRRRLRSAHVSYNAVEPPELETKGGGGVRPDGGCGGSWWVG